MVLQIHEVQGTSGSKDHFPSVEAHSTVQPWHSWLQPYQGLPKTRSSKFGIKAELAKLKMLPSRRASSSLKIYSTHWLADDLNLFLPRFIKLIGIARVAAVVGLGWNFSALLLQCLLYETTNSPTNSGTSIHRNSMHKWIYYRNLNCVIFWIH